MEPIKQGDIVRQKRSMNRICMNFYETAPDVSFCVDGAVVVTSVGRHSNEWSAALISGKDLFAPKNSGFRPHTAHSESRPQVPF